MKKKRILNKYNSKKEAWLKNTKRFVILVLALLVVFRFIIGFSHIDGDSMLNTLKDGELVMYSRIVPSVKRGDIISLKLLSGEFYAKRIIGLGGDVIDLRDGVLYVNGEPEQGDYFIGTTLPEEGPISYPYTVPDGTLFALGDNREDSLDSRYYLFHLSDITGLLLFKMGWFYVNPLF